MHVRVCIIQPGWPQLNVFCSLVGVSTPDPVPRAADADDGRQGALPPGGALVRRQGQQPQPAEGEAGGEDLRAVQTDGKPDAKKVRFFCSKFLLRRQKSPRSHGLVVRVVTCEAR